ncbi:TerD family protein [Cellulomonas rhizosphaerae]|uniref:Stress protein n=1 Tax=Cellulomonas rhizosphaerae TaxID=2293719 RepID=A0A413RKL7_9CELL|nr:TerD family protein [Cellulomonas rhizosphaerae]RHA39791.1 stress protein [Cellulomonas rhizosphaerae]
MSSLELAKGQNVPWPHAGALLEVAGSSVAGCDVSVLLVDEGRRAASSGDFVFSDAPAAPGATLEPGTPARVRLDLAAIPARVHAALCLISVDAHRPPLGDLPQITAVLRSDDGAERARFALAGLTSEHAVVAVEVYRRGAGWKLRAIGQGYDGGLAQALSEHGLEVDQAPAGPPPPPPPGTADGERLLRQASAIFEDAARSTAGLRSSVDYADRRRDEALAAIVADPRLRSGPAHQQAAAAAEGEHADLVRRARERHDDDLRQLSAELGDYEARLPAAMAPWTSSAWRGWRPPALPAPAVRVGDLHVAEAPWLRLPMLLGLPLPRALWIDTATGPGGVAVRNVRSLVTRLLAAYPAGGLEVLVIDLGRALAPALTPLAQPGSRVMTTPAATSAAAAREVLDALVRRVDLVQMARSGNAMDALDGDRADRLLVVHDFPTAFDDAAVGRVRHLVDEGPSAGVQVLLTGEHSPVLDGSPLVSTLFRESLRLPLEPDDHIADAWTGTSWRFTPDLGPDDAGMLDGVLRSAAGTG